MNINFDILLEVMSHLESRTDILAFMKTCHTLYQSGMRYLLGVPIVFDPEWAVDKKLESRRRFFTADPASRLRYLRGLTLSLGGVGPPITDLLKNTLECGRALQALQFGVSLARPWSGSAPWKLHSDLAYSLKNLTKLVVSDVEVWVAELLWTIEAPLRELALSFDVYDRKVEKNPLEYVDNFTSTLEELYVVGGVWDDSFEDLQCLRLHTLIIRAESTPKTDDLIYSFPNLKHLDLLSTPDSDPGVALRNEEALMELDDEDWLRLDTVFGSAKNLASLGLLCSIEYLVVWCDYPDYIGDCFDFVHRTEPTRLRTRFYGGVFLLPKCQEFFDYPGLSQLSIEIFFHGPRGSVKGTTVDRSIDGLLSALERTSLKYLRIHISCEPHSTGVASIIQQETFDSEVEFLGKLDSIARYMYTLDVENLAHRIVNTQPSLQQVIITLTPPGGLLNSVVWRTRSPTIGWHHCVQADGSPCLEALAEDDLKQLLSKHSEDSWEFRPKVFREG